MNFEGLKLEILPTVYEPAEDSFLLAKYSKLLKGKILDMGCGCGIQSLLNARENPSNLVYGVDLNLEAVRNSDHNKYLNRIRNVKFSTGDLFSNLDPVSDQFDSIVFNPPYLPTAENEKLTDDLNLAFDGGIDGRLVLKQFLDVFDLFLRPKGELLLLQSSLNSLDGTTKLVESKGFKVNILDRQKFFFEELSVVKAAKNAYR